ncbi:MAG: hypothetical protein NTU84_10565, partial [Verrucomicrobia bacterium]|nr:hypothetical protein [Verrucomicrobiota bacterium]
LRVLVFNGGSFGCHAHGMLEMRSDVKPSDDFLRLKNRVFLKGSRNEFFKKFTSLAARRWLASDRSRLGWGHANRHRDTFSRGGAGAIE